MRCAHVRAPVEGDGLIGADGGDGPCRDEVVAAIGAGVPEEGLRCRGPAGEVEAGSDRRELSGIEPGPVATGDVGCERRHRDGHAVALEPEAFRWRTQVGKADLSAVGAVAELCGAGRLRGSMSSRRVAARKPTIRGRDSCHGQNCQDGAQDSTTPHEVGFAAIANQSFERFGFASRAWSIQHDDRRLSPVRPSFSRSQERASVQSPAAPGPARGDRTRQVVRLAARPRRESGR